MAHDEQAVRVVLLLNGEESGIVSAPIRCPEVGLK